MTRLFNFKALLLTPVLVLLSLTASVYADVPNVISYQGRMTDDDGNPINGTKLIKFKIYGSAAGDDSLWSSNFRSIEVNEGLFKYDLGSNVPLPGNLFSGDSIRYLGITVDTDDEIGPRIQLISVPYALHTLSSDTAAYALDGPGAGAWVDDGSVVRLANINDRVGIGTSTASEKLVVGWDIGYYGHKYIVSGSPYLDDVCGYKMGHNSDNHATLQWDGDGVPFAVHTRQNGVTYNNTITVTQGKVGIGTTSPSEILTVGDDLTTFSGNILTVGDADSTSYAGISFGQDADNRGWMVYDNEEDYIYWGTKENGTFAPGRMILKNGNLGIQTTPLSGAILAIDKTYNLLNSLDWGYGIHCQITNIGPDAWTHTAGYFRAAGVGSKGIHAITDNQAFGIAGEFESLNGLGLRVEGTTSAAHFIGDVDVYGNLTKTSGSFRIDHPLDPANKYLFHSFVESPDMMNVYNGNITTDSNGDAEVVLPDYFEALNKDFRYQLTVIGTFAQAIVSREIKDGRFEIKTDKPNVKVSWQVTGIRQDPWANEHRIQVEVDKNENERGYYVAPELYGFGKDRRIDYTRMVRK